jgi:alpha-glucosidase
MTRLLLALLLSLPGSACLYQGEELGLPEAVLREADIRDPFGLTYWPEFKGRDGSRTPMPWRGDLPHAGFTTPRSTPWLPVAHTHYDLSVSEQEMAPDSTLAFTRSLLRLRRDEPALRHGRARSLELPAPLLGFTRGAAGRRITVLFNLSDEAVALPPELADGLSPLLGPSVEAKSLPA